MHAKPGTTRNTHSKKKAKGQQVPSRSPVECTRDHQQILEELFGMLGMLVGELSDFQFDVKYREGKVNIDADTLSRLPLDIKVYASECTEELHARAIQATWEGSHASKMKAVAWVAALYMSTEQDEPH